MWTYLQPWIVKDGELPALVRGSVISKKGIRVSCSSVGVEENRVSASDALTRVTDPTGNGSITYAIVGTVEWSRPSTREALLTFNSIQVLAESVTPAELLRPSNYVQVVGELSIVAEYEWEAFALPDIRADWSVRDILIEYREVQHMGDTSYPRRVVDRAPIDRAANDALEKAELMYSYLLDLRLVPTSLE